MDNKYFENALSGFIFDMAAGSAIRHLADKGYTVKRIKDNIGYPVPFEKIQQTVWNYFLAEKILLDTEPGSKPMQDKITYTEKINKYGRKSFCGTVTRQQDYREILWEVTEYNKENKQNFFHYISEKCNKHEEKEAYISCDFGIIQNKDLEKFHEITSVLSQRQQEYITGLPWPCRRVYHRLDLQMQEIAGSLYEKGLYSGNCYFTRTCEKIIF